MNINTRIDNLLLVVNGNEDSGNYGHKGRPGLRGGSASSFSVNVNKVAEQFVKKSNLTTKETLAVKSALIVSSINYSLSNITDIKTQPSSSSFYQKIEQEKYLGKDLFCTLVRKNKNGTSDLTDYLSGDKKVIEKIDSTIGSYQDAVVGALEYIYKNSDDPKTYSKSNILKIINSQETNLKFFRNSNTFLLDGNGDLTSLFTAFNNAKISIQEYLKSL